MERETEDFRQVIGKRVQHGFFALARRALKDLADRSLEEQMVARFCGKLRDIPEGDRTNLSAALEESSDPLCIRSAFALPTKQQSVLQTALNEAFRRQTTVRYEVAPDLIGGVELIARGQRLAWSMSDYLAALEREISASPTPPNIANSEGGGVKVPPARPALAAVN